MRVARIRYGCARNMKRGTVFKHFPGDPDRWIHQGCVHGSGVDIEFMKLEKCVFCDGQFFEAETALELVSGRLSRGPGDPCFVFTEEHIGHIHWACAVDSTDLPIDIDSPDME